MYSGQLNPAAMPIHSVLKSDHSRGAHPNMNGHSRLSSSDPYTRSNEDSDNCKQRIFFFILQQIITILFNVFFSFCLFLLLCFSVLFRFVFDSLKKTFAFENQPKNKRSLQATLKVTNKIGSLVSDLFLLFPDFRFRLLCLTYQKHMFFVF